MNILLVDDHALFREGLALLLHSLLSDVSTAEARSCEQAFAHLRGGAAVDLILLDLGLPGMSGFDGLAQIRREFPDIPVVVLSSSEDRASVLRAIDGGAMGFVPKSASSGVLEGALKVILAKGVYLPATVFLAERSGVEASAPEAAGLAPPAHSGVQRGLTPPPQRRATGIDAAPDRRAAPGVGRQVEQIDLSRLEFVAEHGEDAYLGSLARAQRHHPHPGGHCCGKVGIATSAVTGAPSIWLQSVNSRAGPTGLRTS